MEDKNNYGDLLRLVIKSVLLALCGVFFPFIYIFLPAMYIAESIKRGILEIIGVFLGLCLVIGLIFSPINGVVIFTIFGPLILVFHYMIVSKKSAEMTLIAGAVSFFTSVIILLISFGVNAEVLNSKDTISGLINLYTDMGREVGMSESEIFMISSKISEMYKMFLQMAPSYLIISSLVFSYIIYISVTRTMYTRGKIIIGPPSLELLRIPRDLIFLGIITIVVFKIFNISKDYEIISKNLLYITLFLLFVEGLAIVKFFMTSMKVNRFLQTIIIIISLTFSYVQLLLIFLGFVDLIVNFRKLVV